MRHACKTTAAAFAAALALAAGFLSVRAQAPAPDPWAPLRFLAGTWEGSGSGKPGEVISGSCTFAFELEGRILVRTNRAEYAPKAGEKAKTVHEDRLIVYHDPGTVAFSAIYFDNEGHTIHYAVSVPAAGKAVFESAAHEGAPRFRLTHELLSDGTLATEFAMAPPGGPFQTYTRGITKKTK